MSPSLFPQMTLVINLIGWVGSAAVIIAYILVSTNRLRGDSIPYQILNLFGGIFLMTNTLYFGAYPSSFVNLIWVGFAIIALIRARR
jgi:hypothetical protein